MAPRPIVWTGVGNTVNDGITKNLWQAVLPAAQAPWGIAENWGMPRKETRTPACG